MSDMPETWTSVAIGDVIALNPKTDAPDDVEAGFSPMPMLGVTYLSKPGFEARAWGAIKKSYTHFADGDVLLAKITPCFENGKAGLAQGLPNGIGAGSSEYFVCRPNTAVLDGRYLLAFLKTDAFVREGETQMTGSVGHKRVPKDYLLGTQLPLAPLLEQKRIADKLDLLLSRVDACRTRLGAVPALLKKFRQEVVDSAVDGRLEKQRPDARGKWKKVHLRDVCVSIADGDHQAPPQVVTGIPFITISAISDGRIDLARATRYVPESYFASLSDARRPRPGDVLYSVTGSIGIPALVVNEARFTFQRHIAILRPDSHQISAAFLALALGSTKVRQQALDVATGSAQLTIPLGGLRRFAISLPELAEQNEIVRRVESLFALADNLEGKYETACDHVERLTPALLAKAFRGELVPQDPNDEPAGEMLRRLCGEAKHGFSVHPAPTKRGRHTALARRPTRPPAAMPAD